MITLRELVKAGVLRLRAQQQSCESCNFVHGDRPTGRDESSRFRVAASAIVQACAEPPLPPRPEGHGAPVGAR